MIRVGTSGWQYDDWRGTFYPDDLPKRQWLEVCSRRFPTIEVNNTFYRLPERDTFERWREETPAGFCFTVKASRYLTHVRRLVDPQEPVQRLWERALGLGDRLGPVLFQLPPNFKVDLDRLAGLLEVLPSSMRPALEFRDVSWDRPEVHEHARPFEGCAGVGRPGPHSHERATGGWLYLRFHRADSSWEYGRERLRPWAERIASIDAREVFVYFNNDPGAAAIRDADTMIELLTELVPERLAPR